MSGWWKQSVGFAAAKSVLAAVKLSDAPERRLMPQERAVLEPIYEGSVDLSRVRLRTPLAGVLAMTRRAFVIENTVFVPRRFLPLQTAVLVHEICHVWQHQHGGHAYIADSLHAQLVGDGYELDKGIREGKPWHGLNCEQQATLVEEGYLQRSFDGRPFMSRDLDCTEYFLRAIKELRAGRGASFR
jgi:hypothetical protein